MDAYALLQKNAASLFYSLRMRLFSAIGRQARRVLEIHMQFAFDHAIIQFAALVRFSSKAALKQRVRAEDILFDR